MFQKFLHQVPVLNKTVPHRVLKVGQIRLRAGLSDTNLDCIGIANIHGLVPNVKIKILHTPGGSPLIPHLILDIITQIRPDSGFGIQYLTKTCISVTTLAVSLTAIALGMMNWGSLLPA